MNFFLTQRNKGLKVVPRLQDYTIVLVPGVFPWNKKKLKISDKNLKYFKKFNYKVPVCTIIVTRGSCFFFPYLYSILMSQVFLPVLIVVQIAIS